MNKKLIASLLLSLSLPAYAGDGAADAEPCRKAQKSGDYAQAIILAQQALSAWPDDRELYMCLGRAQGSAGDSPAAIRSLQLSDKFSKTPFEHVTAQLQLGNQYKSAKSYSEALAAYRQGLALAHEDKNKRYEMIALNLVGETLQEKGDFTSAIESYHKGYKLAANDNERADSHAHLANTYRAAGQLEPAISEQLKAAVLQERSGDLDHYAFASQALADLYLEVKQYAEAEKVLRNILAVVTQAGDEYWQASIYQMQGRVKLAQGNAEEGRALFKRGADLARKIGAEDLARDIEATGAM